MAQINNMEQYSARGIWKIVDVYPSKNKHRLGRYVVFPWDLISRKDCARWMYIPYDKKEEKGGQICITSLITDISYMEEVESLQISTENSQYVFNRIL